MIIDLSPSAQVLVRDYLATIDREQAEEEVVPSQVEFGTVCAWLLLAINKNPNPNQELIAAVLCEELLQSINNSLPAGNIVPKPVELEPTASKTKLFLLVLAGMLVVACEGFDGVTTILSILSLPSFLIFIAGLGFSILSVILFCSFDILQVARELGVTLWEGPKLLNVYLQQLHTIKELRRKIEGYQLAELSTDELKNLESLVLLLQERLEILRERCASFDLALNRTSTRVTKFIIAAMSGMLFFGGGFFAGQSVAAFICAAFLTSIPAFWPVLLFSCFVGLAAFYVYWCLERPGVQKLISTWFGLDEDKVELLCSTEKHEREQSKLTILQQNVRGILHLKLESNKPKIDDASADESNANEEQQKIPVGANRFGFHANIPDRKPGLAVAEVEMAESLSLYS